MIAAIKKQILAIFEDCRDLSAAQILNLREDRFGPHMEALNRLAARDIEDAVVDALIDDTALQPAIEKIASLKQVHGLRLERERAGEVLRSATPRETLEGFVYYPNYLGLAEMEFSGAGLKPDDRVVFLGSGPLPLSLITMVRRYGVRGVGIERDPLNADLSQQVLAALNLGDEIDIVAGDHFVLPLPVPCNLVMVGADAVPKGEIFTHLAETLPDGMKISYRVYQKGLRRLFDTDHVQQLPHPLREYRRIPPEPPVNNTSVFVVKGAAHG